MGPQGQPVDGRMGGSTPPSRATAWIGAAWRGSAWRGEEWQGNSRMVAPVVRLHWRELAWHGTAWRGLAGHGMAWALLGVSNDRETIWQTTHSR